jgi:hypothetical protein
MSSTKTKCKAPSFEEFEMWKTQLKEYNINPDDLCTQDEMEEIFLCDDGSEYCGDDYLMNTGWRYNEYIERWIHIDDLPDEMESSDFVDLFAKETPSSMSIG